LETSQVRVRLSATLSPSEDPGKVLAAMKNVVGDRDIHIEEAADSIELSSTSIRSLQKVHDQLRDRHVRDAARRLLLRRQDGDNLTLLLNRQAAAAGVIVVCSNELESPLGPIVLEIHAPKSQELIDWLTAH
jgi:predicted RNA binding protein with dsRBD fold (UPF0201 family)